MVRVGVIVEGGKYFRRSRNFDELSVRASSRLRTPIGDTIFEIKVISAHTVQCSKSFSEATFRTSFVFSSGSGLGKRYFSEVRVRVGIWLGKKSGLNDPRFGASSFLSAWWYDARRLSARTHSCMLKQFFPRHSTQTSNQLRLRLHVYG